MEQITYDFKGYDTITKALRELLNKYPGLDMGEIVDFAQLDADGGLAMFPTSGSVVRIDRHSITGNVYQECLYPFTLVMRSARLNSNRKANAKEWLDNFGKWLEKAPVTFDGGNTYYKIDEYPTLTEGRKILEIARTSVSFLDSQDQDGIEDWVISMQLKYSNEYEL